MNKRQRKKLFKKHHKICVECRFNKSCQRHEGKFSFYYKKNMEDCTALVNSHFCLKSWEPYFQDCSKIVVYIDVHI